MDFDDCGYELQQVQPRTRREKEVSKSRDALEKSRMVARVEGHIRFQTYGDLVKPCTDSAFHIDDIKRFDRDYVQEQRITKRMLNDLTLARAAARREQKAQYMQHIEGRRKEEAEEDAKLMGHYSQNVSGKESVLYDPVTNIAPAATTEKGKTQTAIDTRRAAQRQSRALQIQHKMHSTQYDPVNGKMRTFW